MSRAVLRLATADDLRSFYGCEPSAEWCAAPPAGHVATRDGRDIAIGVVTLDRYGRVWGWFDMREPLPAVLVHRYARRLLAALRQDGIEALHAICDRRKPRAEAWLRRLGFHEDDEMTRDPAYPVWTCKIAG